MGKPGPAAGLLEGEASEGKTEAGEVESRRPAAGGGGPVREQGEERRRVTFLEDAVCVARERRMGTWTGAISFESERTWPHDRRDVVYKNREYGR